MMDLRELYQDIILDHGRQLRRSGTENSLTLRWREMDSNFKFRAK
jgi:hypothetical protein